MNQTRPGGASVRPHTPLRPGIYMFFATTGHRAVSGAGTTETLMLRSFVRSRFPPEWNKCRGCIELSLTNQRPFRRQGWQEIGWIWSRHEGR